jgi:uncharacterized protein (TIGR02231 family)
MIRKNVILVSLFTLLVSLLHAQTAKPIKAKLDRATVYLQGAHLYYSESVLLKTGYNELVFENISPQINVASLQAYSKGGVVMDVKYDLKYREKPVVTRTYDAEIARVLDSIEEVAFILTDLTNREQVIATEKRMLLNNPIIKGSSNKDSIPILKDGMAFLREKLNNIYDVELKLTRQKSKHQKIKNRLDARYNELIQLQENNGEIDIESTQPISQVKVNLYSENAGTATVNFNYFVAQANWYPLYDIQASSTQNKLQLKYMANVSQGTGIDWKGVALTLSTSNPQENNTKPELTPWYVSFIAHVRKAPVKYLQRNSMLDVETVTAAPRMASKSKAEESHSADELDMNNYVAVTENLIRTEYEIKLNYNIQSDNQPHKVIINQRDVPMQLQFAAVPKICTDAYLMANITGWEDLNIIPGNSRLFFDDAFVGEMYLNPQGTTDTVSINLGRDKGIAITRKKIKDKTKTKLLDNEKVETRSMEIVVRNTKSIGTEIVVEDQIPVVSGTDEIKINLLNGDGAELDPLTGKLIWRIKLGSKDTKRLVFTYEIRYPKDKVVYGL